MRSNTAGNINFPHPAVPAGEHEIVVGGREKGSSGRDIGQSNQSNSNQNRKRQSVDGEEYPRRRAAIAVSIYSLVLSLHF